ncbi:hypothetical protein OSH11_24435 [Kaistia dalseonensis]|uniref:Uncharacterized protein with LGFP repeats n=1 Tax=Kaistia dalseonensis TaxID=410840 RepID=A0ABU0HDW0_9HYPH|nr:hypothetical protein [Kaistia dalseonensis]MCX5497868.1 hypothetical protein [Kaistia dalseonensis]MDQ0440512.1 uncharacterized protein with LGFP repeats [Kaistia dalseonensis]
MADALFGKTWHMNSGASIFSSDFKPATETRLYEERDNGYKLTVSGSNNGNYYQWWYEAYHDGKSYPVHGRSDVSAITIYRISDKITVGFFEKEVSPGVMMPGGPYARKLSADGTSLEVQAAGRNSDGTAFFDVINYQL